MTATEAFQLKCAGQLVGVHLAQAPAHAGANSCGRKVLPKRCMQNDREAGWRTLRATGCGVDPFALSPEPNSRTFRGHVRLEGPPGPCRSIAAER